MIKKKITSTLKSWDLDSHSDIVYQLKNLIS